MMLHPDHVWWAIDNTAGFADRRDIIRQCKAADVNQSRKAVALALVEDCGLPLLRAAEIMHRDHTTVLHNKRTALDSAIALTLHSALCMNAQAHSQVCTPACRFTHRAAIQQSSYEELRGAAKTMPFWEVWPLLRPGTREVVAAIADGCTMEEISAAHGWGKNKYLAATREMTHLLDIAHGTPLKIVVWYWRGQLAMREQGIDPAALLVEPDMPDPEEPPCDAPDPLPMPRTVRRRGTKPKTPKAPPAPKAKPAPVARKPEGKRKSGTLYSFAEIAEGFGVDRDTVLRWIALDCLPTAGVDHVCEQHAARFMATHAGAIVHTADNKWWLASLRQVAGAGVRTCRACLQRAA